MADAAFSTPSGRAQDTTFFPAHPAPPQADARIQTRFALALTELGDAITLESRLEDFRGGLRAFDALSIRSETAWNGALDALQVTIGARIVTPNDAVCQRAANLLLAAIGAESTTEFVRAALHPVRVPRVYEVNAVCPDGPAAATLVATALHRLRALGDLELFQALEARHAPIAEMSATPPICAI